jgi:hypothetical protein
MVDTILTQEEWNKFIYYPVRILVTCTSGKWKKMGYVFGEDDEWNWVRSVSEADWCYYC